MFCKVLTTSFASLLCSCIILSATMLNRFGHSLLLANSLPMLSRVRGGAVKNPSISTTAMRAAASPVGVYPYSHSEAKRISVSAVDSVLFTGDVLIVPMFKPKVDDKGSKEEKDQQLLERLIPALPAVKEELHNLLKQILEEKEFKAEVASKQVVRVMGSNDLGVKYIALVGLGSAVEGDNPDLDVRTAMKLGKAVATIAKETKSESVGLIFPTGATNAAISPFMMSVQDSLYQDKRFKKEPEGGFPPLKWKQLQLLGCSSKVAADVKLNQKLTEMIVSGVDFAKDLVGAPPNFKTPVAIADLAKEMAAQYDLSCTVLGEAECKERGMGAYLGVQQGSQFPPQFVHLTYKPKNASDDVVKVALVGKGLTFDSGGYNLKSGGGSMIELMKFDMGGCAAVLGCAKAIAQLRPMNVEVHFITALCENMISAEAMRPGDILVASNGKSIEVLNTDAEGRLTLADALVYAEQQGVDTIVDLATLTGACIAGLGSRLAALYSPDDALLNDLLAAAKRCDEGLWHMPLEATYKDSIKGTLADVKNIASLKGGGSITAALFLQEFVDKAKWAHIDMAGPVWEGNKATGYGVKTLTDFLLNIKKKEK